MSHGLQTVLARLAGAVGVAFAIAGGALLHSALTTTLAPSLVLSLSVILLAAVLLIVFAASRERREAARRQTELLSEIRTHAEILARQRDEARLLESAVVHTRNGVLVLEAQPGRRVLYANEAFCRITGYEAQELLGQPYPDPTTDEVDPVIRKGIEVAFESGQLHQVELWTRRKDGTGYWVDLSLVPVPSPSGGTAHWVAIQRDATERKRTEEALRSSERRLRLLGDNLPGGAIYHIVADSPHEVKFAYISAGIEQILGIHPEELLDDATSAYRLIRPDDLEKVRAAQLASHRDLTPFDVEFRTLTRGGQLKWVHCRSMPSRRTDGRMERFGVILDVTARRLTEERYRLIVESTPECVKLLDIDGTILEMNPAGLAMIEAERADQVVGQCAYFLVAPEHREAFQSFNERVCRGEPGSLQYDIIGFKGMRRRLATTATPLRDGSGRVAQLAVTHDITESKRAEEALRQSEALFRGIFEGSAAGITLTDSSGRFVSCNPAFAALVGRTVHEVLQLSPVDLTHPDDWAAQKPVFEESLSGRRDRYEFSKRYLRPDGSVVWTELSFAAIRGPNGEYQYGLGVTIDTTVRRQLEDQLQEARKLEAIGRLAGGIAHDFNNLITGVIGNLSLIQLPADDPSRANLAAIDQAAMRAADLTRKLLGFARRSQLLPVPVEPRQAFDSAIRTVRRTIDSRIHIAMGVSPGCGALSADPALLNQVLLDLCWNACDAMPNGGTLTLGAGPVSIAPNDPHANPESRPGPYIRLSVADTGGGMTDEVRSQIFEPFFTTKEPGKARGLGLAMVQGIVKQHGGWVECRSAPGAGACFDLFFDAVLTGSSASRLIHVGNAADATTITPGPSEPTKSHDSLEAARKKTILLVDDEPMIRTLGRTVLERAGYRVLLAHDGINAVETVGRERARIGLIVMDMTMPRLSGRDAYRQISQIEPGIPVLFSSGYSAEDVSDLEGSIGLLSKPYRPSELLAVVRKALEGNIVQGAQP